MSRARAALPAAALAALLAACAAPPAPDGALRATDAAYEAARRAGAADLAPADFNRAREHWALAHALADARRDDEALRMAELASADAATAQANAEAERTRRAEAKAAAERDRLRQASSAQTPVGGVALEAERTAALASDLASLQAQRTDRGVIVTLGDVLFQTGSAALPARAEQSAQRIAAVLRRHPDRRVRIEGHTDNTGAAAMNLALSQRRADSLKDALLRAGLAAGRIDTRAYGESRPVADNATATGRAQNRRVEVLFSDGQGRLPPG